MKFLRFIRNVIVHFLNSNAGGMFVCGLAFFAFGWALHKLAVWTHSAKHVIEICERANEGPIMGPITTWSMFAMIGLLAICIVGAVLWGALIAVCWLVDEWRGA